MIFRLIPGLLIATALGIFFCLPAEPYNGDFSGRQRSVTVAHADPILFTAEPQTAPAQVVRFKSALLPKIETKVDSNPSSRLFSSFPENENTGTHEDIMAMAAASEQTTENKAAKPRMELSIKKAFHAAPPALLGKGITIASGTAFANADSGAITARSVQRELPDHGLRAWGQERIFSEKQKLRNMGLTAYSFDGSVHSAGIKKDWSVDSTFGLSLDYLDGKLKSGHAADSRKDEIGGYFVNAHYDGILMYKYPFNLNFVYGRVENQTKGNVFYPGTSTTDVWEDEKHKSDIYGFSANVSVPMILPSGIKMLAEFGLDYRKLNGQSYNYSLNGRKCPVDIAKAVSTSLQLPITLTVSKDYLYAWGLISPRFNIGMSLEFDDSAMGVHTLNSSAASWVSYHPGVFRDIERDSARQELYQIGVGVDIKSVGGWEIGAGFTRYLGEKYNQNEFRLELGRCF